MILLAISMLGTLNLSVQAAEKDTDFFEEYQDQETLKLYMQAYVALYNDTTYEYREMPEIDLAEYYAERIQMTGSFSDYFTKVECINRNGEISLSIYPTSRLFGENYDNPNRFMAQVNYADSMFAQFHCHAMFAGDNKIPWNIEPWRTESNLVKVIAAKCNP